MKITKKFLSILLATILILSVFPVTLAQATDSAITFSVETDAKNVKVGDTISVSVNMSEYRKLGALTLYVNYDSTALEIVNVQTNNVFGYEEFNTDYGSGKLAYLIASLDTKTVSGTLFTIQFEVLKEGCTEVLLTVDELTDIDLNKLSSSTQSAKVHKFNNGTVTPPTCTKQGFTTYVCECGNSYTDNYVDALGHSFGNWTTENAPTCTETGLEKRVCSACGETETNELSVIGHNYVNGECTECGSKQVFWCFDESTGTLTIYGVGSMYDYYDEENDELLERPWDEFSDDIKAVVIDDGITSVGDCAFYGCENIETVSISNDVTTICDGAFAYCNGLASIIIPDSVTSVNYAAFGCCEKLKSVKIGNSVELIGEQAFAFCYSLENIVIPDSVITIDDGAFEDCTSLKSLTIGNNVKTINDWAFSGCSSLESVVIPESVTKIGYIVFDDCVNLKNITVDSNNKYYSSDKDGVLFDKNKTQLIKYPAGNEDTRYEIPDRVILIDAYAFEDCKDLEYISIPEGVTKIDYGTFRDCIGLKYITIPKNVTEISDYAFNNCGNITDIYYGGTKEDWKSIDIGYGNETLKNATMHYCAFGICGKKVTWTYDGVTHTLTISGTGDMYDYEYGKLPWEIHKKDIEKVIIGNGVTSIGKFAFDFCTALTNVSIPYGIVSIGDSAFSNCHILENVTIPESVTSIGEWTFSDCYGFKNIIIPDSVISIGNYAFAYCDSLESVVIGNNVESIGEGAFVECLALKTVTIPASVTFIDIYAFGCTGLECITVDSNNQYYSNDEFGVLYNKDKTTLIQYPYGNKNKSYTIPKGVTSIGYCAFYYCTELESIVIPDDVNLIELGAYAYCENLKDVYYSGAEEDWNNISIDDYNEPLLNAKIHYNYCEHKYNPVVTPPTCTEGGYTTYTCACGDTYVSDETSATGHDYEKEITTAPTHTENGVMTYTCVCGDTYTESIDATGDHYHVPSVTAPTCTEGGYTTYTCVCGDTYIDDNVDATGHKYESEITKPATHLAEGLMTYTCHCGDSYTEIIEKIAEHNHETVVTPPTCTEGGYTTYTCECGDTYVADYVNANGHSYSPVVTPPTCTETGYTTYTCTVCGDTYVADYVNANGHSYNSVVTVPTCTEQGFTTYTCAVCNDTYVDDEIPATGHSYQNGICIVCDYADPDYFVFSVKEPSITKIRNKDGIILHAEIEGNRPEGSYVEWTVDNGNFDKTAMNNGDALRVIANNKGYTTFTATLYDADGNELAKDTVELYSQSGFFDKIGGFFRSLFGTTKIYEN